MRNLKSNKTNKGFQKKHSKIIPKYFNNTNPHFLEINNKYVSGVIICSYKDKQTDLLLMHLINLNIEFNTSIFYERQESNKVLRELTYHIGNLGVDLKGKNKNKLNKNYIQSAYEDAKYIRREIQIKNEEFYYLYIYFNILSKNKEDIKLLIQKLNNTCQINELKIRQAICRQEQVFFSCVPLMENHLDIKNIAKKNILSSGLVCTYPFATSTIYDKGGILYGRNMLDNSLIFINKFDFRKYKNSNMLVLGVSGAGKSYYTKLMILRQYLYGINQYIIDPEREYGKMCEHLGGSLVKLGGYSGYYINAFDIRQESLEEGQKGYLLNKINRLTAFLNLIFRELSYTEKVQLEKKLILCYEQKGITFDDNSLWVEEVNKNEGRVRFKKPEEMPVLEDLYCALQEDEETVYLANQLFPYIKGSISFLNGHTNVKLDNKLVVIDINELEEEGLTYGMHVVMELFWDKIKANRNQKKIIYLDEIWRLIGVTSNKYIANFVYKVFKTIRKYNGGIIGITQDISDLFSLEGGVYGKSIFNNTEAKVFFSLEQENINLIKEYLGITEEEGEVIKGLEKGQALLNLGNEKGLLKVEAADFEKEIIE